MREHEPELQEDAKNLSVVTGSALVAALITLGLFVNKVTAAPEQTVVDVQPVVVEIVEIPAPEPEPVVEIEPVIVEPVRAPLTGINRLYGTVTTSYGAEFTGYIRWDRNEGSWTDLLDASKPRYRGGSRISGIRFGHVDRIDVTGRSSAAFTLRSGQRMELLGNATDLGSGLRALVVEEANGNLAEFSWRDLESIDFEAPGSTPPASSRMFGTLLTRSGLEFTGYVTWDIDEIYSTDILDGDHDGERMRIPFGEIASIERNGRRSSVVTLTNGRSYVLEGTNDVDASISGIEISDATLGAVKLDWNDFDRVEFHGTEDEVAAANFDGGRRLHGTVVDRFGDEHTGDIVWDADEEYTWEMLNGKIDGIDLHIEFGQIERIERSRDGARVTLLDGRSFDLTGSNDVDRSNGGLTIRTDGREYEVDWADFDHVTFSR